MQQEPLVVNRGNSTFTLTRLDHRAFSALADGAIRVEEDYTFWTDRENTSNSKSKFGGKETLRSRVDSAPKSAHSGAIAIGIMIPSLHVGDLIRARARWHLIFGRSGRSSTTAPGISHRHRPSAPALSLGSTP